ncbi:MAG: Holliday junction resolvase RuvX, partial [Planctomycetota bacterium]
MALAARAMRFLSIDLGDKRTGFASGDDVLGIVQPLRVAEAPTRALQLKAALAAIDEYGPDRVVVGLPLNMDGAEGPRCQSVRQFVANVVNHGPPALASLPVVMQDERMS